jgi:hypothetical protein
MKKMRILLIYEKGSGGGAQTHVQTLATALKVRGHVVRLQTVSRMPSENFTFVLLLTLVRDFLSLPYLLAKTLVVIKKNNFEFVHVHTPRVPLVLGCAFFWQNSLNCYLSRRYFNRFQTKSIVPTGRSIDYY